MPGSKWFMKSIEQTLTATGYIIVITTDTPCHLWMRWTTIEPKEHLIQRTKRGLAHLVDKYFCFDAYHDNEQEEAGDTLEHTFTKEPWPVCETRYFYFHGEIAGVASKSTSAILSKHRVAPPAEPITAYFYPDAHPEVSSVDGFSQRRGLDQSWSDLVIGEGTHAWDGPLNLDIQLYARSIIDLWYQITRTMLVFDTTIIPLRATILSASLDVYCKVKWDALNATPSLVLTSCNPASVTAIVPADYRTITSTLLSDVIPYTDISIETWLTFTLNANGLLAVTREGWTKLAIRSYPYDVLGAVPPWVAGKYSQFQFRAADTFVAKRPRLTVTYLA